MATSALDCRRGTRCRWPARLVSVRFLRKSSVPSSASMSIRKTSWLPGLPGLPGAPGVPGPLGVPASPQISVAQANRATPGARGKYRSQALVSRAREPRANVSTPDGSADRWASADASTRQPTLLAADAMAAVAAIAGDAGSAVGSYRSERARGPHELASR